MAEFWEYDARLMRRWNTDPLAHAGQSLYEAFYSNPIAFADPLGLKPEGDIGSEGGPGKRGTINGTSVASTAVVVARRTFGEKVRGFFAGIMEFFNEKPKDIDNSYRKTTVYRLEHKKTKGPLDVPNKDFSVPFKRGWENPNAALQDNPYGSLNTVALAGIGGTLTVSAGASIVATFSPSLLKEFGEGVVEEVTGIPVGLIGIGKEAVEYLGKQSLKEVAEEGLERTTKEQARAVEEQITMYRAVEKGEFDDIQAIKGFRLGNTRAAYEGGKLFATSVQDATNFGKINYLYQKESFTIVKTSIPSRYSSLLHKGEMDGMPAIEVPKDILDKLSKPIILDYAPLPNHPALK